MSGFNDIIENATNTLNLSCIFEGFPTPQIHWYITPTSTRKEKQLSNSERITINHDVDEDGNSFSELIIGDLHKSGERSYKCMSNNDVENLKEAVDNTEEFITIHSKVNLYDHVIQ